MPQPDHLQLSFSIDMYMLSYDMLLGRDYLPLGPHLGCI